MSEQKYRVLLVDKQSGEYTVYQSGLTEKEAESICEAWGWNYIDENGKSYWMEYDYEVEEQEMSYKAEKIWSVAIDHRLESLLEYFVDDMEEFAREIEGDSDSAILKAIYEKIALANV